MIARIKVVLASAVTWIQVLSAVLVIVADEVAKVVGPQWGETVASIVVRVVAVLGAVVAIIRRTTPVLPDQRGLLPPDGGGG